jgi:hypothetical protein
VWAREDPAAFFILYGLGSFLDALDGYAARSLNQSASNLQEVPVECIVSSPARNLSTSFLPSSTQFGKYVDRSVKCF